MMLRRSFLRAPIAMAGAAGLAGIMSARDAEARVEININKGNVEPMPIAITDFISGDALGPQITDVIAADLKRSGLFAPVAKSAFIEKVSNPDQTPRFEDWKVINAQALVTGRLVKEGGRLRADFRLWDTFSGQQMTGQQFYTQPQNWRRVAHIIADAIYKQITGEDGYFDTRVVFVSESGPKNARKRQLAIMDQDGFNARALTNANELVLTPRFSPTTQEITYMAYTGNDPSVFLLNIETGQREIVGNFPGMTFAPRFSPDGGRVAFSVERAGNTDIHVMNLRSRTTTRLTSDPSIETSPSFSPDGARIVYASDRGGSAQLYVMDANGGGSRRISFGSGIYTTPVWSPTGEYIAFTRQNGGEFHIGIMRPDGSGERILTTSYLDEGPTWAPNGRVLMFSRETPGGAPRLWTVDVTGRIQRAAPYPGSGTDPAWSPLLN